MSCEPLLDVVDDFHRVRAGLLANLQEHGRVAVDVGECRHISDAVVDARDVGDLYRVAIDLAQHEAAELVW